MKTFKRLTYPYIIWITAMIVIPMLLIIVYAFTKQGNDVATLQFTLDVDQHAGAYIRMDWYSGR